VCQCRSVIVVSALETISLFATMQMLKGETGRKPGELFFDPLNFKGGEKLATNEIKNGQLAMLAFSGIVTQAALSGKGFPYF
jgi:hypothetical protein